MNIDTNVFWEIIIGITTGVYAGFIVSRMARFSALTGEALRLVRGIDFIYGDVAQEAVTLLKIEEALAQFTLISSDFYSRAPQGWGQSKYHRSRVRRDYRSTTAH
jgi:hypothetical protein